MSNASSILNKVHNGLAVLIDVRSKLEYKMGHAEQSQNIPLDRVGSYNEVGKDTELYVYCASGARSGSAEQILRGQGFTNVKNVGGLGDWRAMGGAIVR